MNAPRVGSTAKAWTDVRMPDRTRKVPTIDMEKAMTASIIVHAFKRIPRGQDRHRMQQRRRCKPRHERCILDRVPEPPAAPSELVIGPIAAGSDPERQEDPGSEHPGPHRSGELPVHVAGQHRADGQAECDRKADIAEVEGRRMEGEAGVLQQGVEPPALRRRRIEPCEGIGREQQEGVETKRQRRLRAQRGDQRAAGQPAREGGERRP